MAAGIDPLVTRYEELRSQVLNSVAAGLGHALLLRQGRHRRSC